MRKLMSFVTGTIACLLLLLVLSAPISAQVVGIFGGVPNPSNNIGIVRFVNIKGTDTLGQTTDYVLPLNGILNYVAYFDLTNAATNTSNPFFQLEGTYTLTYLDANVSPVIPVGLTSAIEGPFNYVPNAGFTSGFQVRPANPGAGGALGIQGFVRDSNNNGIFNAIVVITLQNGPLPIVQFRTRTNANGFYSLYYKNFNTKGTPIGGGTYNVTVTKLVQAGCTKTNSSNTVVYNPTNTTNPSLASYFVTGAAVTVPTVTFNTNVCP